jgi:hypothetical protein
MEILPCQFMAMSFLCMVSPMNDLYKPIIQAFPRLLGLFFKCATKFFNGAESYARKFISLEILFVNMRPSKIVPIIMESEIAF